MRRLRIFVSSPGDVKAAREIAALTIERLAQEYARFFVIEPYLWEFEAMMASGHFQDSIEPPSAFDVVVLILWSRLGTLLPERTAVREYRGIDGRAPVTGTEWEFEEAYRAATQTGSPDLLVYRSLKPASFDTRDNELLESQLLQLRLLNGFWERHFVNQGLFIGAFTLFDTDAEFAASLEAQLRKLIVKKIAALQLSRDESNAKAWSHAPFRGLESYEFEHAPIYFGQDEALAKGMLRLAANAEALSPFLLVLGASGSGKSSLVKAGILPKLFVPRRIPGVAFLRRVIFRPSDAQPGEDLFDAFSRRLTTKVGAQEGLPELLDQGQSLASLAAHFRDAATAPIYPIATALGLLTSDARLSGHMLEHETAKLVVMIDQLEELYNNERISKDERRRFIELVAGLVRSGRVWIVATMRKDFWHRADETPELVLLSEDNRRLELLPPSPAQLSQMIREPARAAGIGFESDAASNVPLNERIAEEVADEPDALPLLSYLLDQLYRIDVLQAQGSNLTYATYYQLGKLEGAVATQAEGVLEKCALDERNALGSLLFSLVDMGGATGDVDRAVARRIPLSTFAPGTPQRRLIDALLDPNARLLVSDSEKGGTPTIRVAHEALILHWARAREFVQGNAQALKIRHRIEELYRRWCGLGAARPKARRAPWNFGREQGLLADIDLLDGQRLLEEHIADTEPHLVDYIERSRADNRRLRTRTLRMLATVAAMVAILAIAASAAGWIATKKQREAEDQAGQTMASQARLLIASASAHLKDANVPMAQGIILEVLTNPGFSHSRTPAAVSAFQDIRAADSAHALLMGHEGFVNSAAYSPDGVRIVTASHDKTLRIWDANTGLQVAVLQGHTDHVNGANFSPDGAHIVSASRDNTARIWDARSGEQIRVLSGHVSRLTSAAYSKDGAHIVTASFDKSARIWDASSGAQLLTLKGHDDLVDDAAYSPDGTRIVTASDDKTARVWDAKTGTQILVLSGHADIVMSAAYSPDGTRIVTASVDKSVRIWDSRTGAQLKKIGLPTQVLNATFSPDSSRVATASADAIARIFDARSGDLLSNLAGHTGTLTSVAYSPDGAHSVTASHDGTVRIWDTDGDSPAKRLSGHTGGVYTAVYSPDGARILTASRDKTARLWDARTGASIKTLAGHSAEVQAAAFSQDGSRIISSGADSEALIWDGSTGSRLATLRGHTQIVNFASFSPDGGRVVTSSFDHTIRIWDTHTNAAVSVLRGHTGIVDTAQYSPDGAHIVSASADKTARIWDSQTGAQLAILKGHGETVETAAYSPDGTRIVTASLDKTARIWDATTGAQLLELSGLPGGLVSAYYSPDGMRIVTVSASEARIWDARSGAQLKVLPDHDGVLVSYAVYSPDGTHIVTAADDMTARIWDASVPAGVDAQIDWDDAAQFDPMSDVDRVQLGLPPVKQTFVWAVPGSACDQTSGAFYDPQRVTQGIGQSEIQADLAEAACAAEIKKSDHPARADYQMGRAQLAKANVNGARQQFERAAARGYPVANIDLARILRLDTSNSGDQARSIALDEKAWTDGMPVAAFELGQDYEHQARPDQEKAWFWYQKGADADEPSALARFAEREDKSALEASDSAKRRALLLQAFGYYTAAAERAKQEDWPDEAWKEWRHRRASIARILADQGMMQDVANTYRTELQTHAPHRQTRWQRIKRWVSP